MKTTQSKMQAIALLVMVIPVLLLSGCSSQNNDTVTAQKLLDYNAYQYDEVEATGELIDGVRVIEITAFQYGFDPKLIVVNKGEKIKIIVNAVDVPHGFEIEGYTMHEYDIETVIRPGIPLEIEFTADEEGVWEFICTIYCGFGHSQMKGIFVVR